MIPDWLAFGLLIAFFFKELAKLADERDQWRDLAKQVLREDAESFHQEMSFADKSTGIIEKQQAPVQ